MIRPKLIDEDVINLAVDNILPQVMTWLRQGNCDSPEDEVRSDITEYVGSEDGYEFCRELEKNKHWECDSELVGILDNFSLWSALREMSKKWVAAYQVFNSHDIGQIVKYKGHSCEITAIDKNEGKYTIFSPEEGHARSGIGTHGHIVDWEVIDGKVFACGLTITGPLLQTAQP